jgi:ribonuclease HI
MSTALVHIDGGCRPTNPGHSGFGIVVSLRGREYIFSRYIGWHTNNYAEFTALIVAVKYVHDLGAESVEVVSDSKLVVEQTHGRWRLKSDDLRPLVMEARRLLDRHFAGRWKLTWSPRNTNVKADYYCGLAINAGRNLNPFVPQHIKDKRPGEIHDPFSNTEQPSRVRARAR